MKRTHGHTADYSVTTEYKTWIGMKRRCYNPIQQGFHRYGGRGIRVCAQWRNSFETFLADVGYKPTPKHSIDRIDSDGHYEPGNVRWATWLQQAANRPQRGGRPKHLVLDVIAMRAMRADTGQSYEKIAKHFGVSIMTAWKAIQG